MKIDEFKEKLRSYDKKDIIITNHAKLQAMIRQIEIREVIENLTNPEKLVYFEEQESIDNKKKYNCYFRYEKHLAHRYILTLNSKVIIVTIIKINRDWQKIIERK